jgi:hypothetical protein
MSPQKVDFKSCGINKPRDRLSGSYNHAEGVAAASFKDAKGAPIKEKRPRTVAAPGRFVLPASYAAICLTNGAVVLTSILRGKAAAATGAVISNTPFTYSAVSFSTFTPSGSVSVLSNTP